MPNTKTVEVGPKLYLNGFPKSGTHLLDSMAVNVMAQANPEDNWMGNVDNSGFGTQVIHLDTFPKMLEEMPMHRYVKGHLAWDKNIAQSCIDNHWCHVFIFRDFRDVAVSMAYHAQKDKEGTNFPKKEKYEEMEYGEVLKRIIAGDENISGVMDRWEIYAPWLNENYALRIDYGYIVKNKVMACELFLDYLVGQTGKYLGITVDIDDESFNKLMHRMMYRLERPERSPTYRNGKTGDWKEHFTNEHKELFKESDKNNWLIRLGYEDDRNW